MAKKSTDQEQPKKSKSKAKPKASQATMPSNANDAAQSQPKAVPPPLTPPHIDPLKEGGLKDEAKDGKPTLEQLKAVDSGLSKRDVEKYRKMLVEKLAEVVGDVELLTSDALGEDGGLSRMPVHLADGGSDMYYQSFNLDLAESERKLVVEIQHALLRIKEGIYGVCLERAVPIGKPRLDVKPWAKYCIEVVREKEKRGLL